MAHGSSGRRTVAPTEHERDAARAADPARGTDRATTNERSTEAAERRRFERAHPMPADRHE